MKLEIKHIAPYLPYGVKFTGLRKGWANPDVGYTLCPDDLGVKYEYIKLHLRPLSDLSILGDDNLRINEHTINLMIQEKFKEDYGMFSHYKGDLELVKEGFTYQTYDSDKTIPFEIFEEVRNELLKGHFDIFGLINEGLAIDINTLQL